MKDALDLESRRDEIEQQITDQIGFSISRRSVTIRERLFSYIAVADEEEVLALITDESGDSPVFQPYWSRLWESTLGLCERLAELPLEQAAVLDVGAGLGIAGCFAASRGANVVMGDVVPAAKWFAEWNAAPWFDSTEAMVLDWRNDNLGRKFDFIVGADVLYHESDWSCLERFWQQHLGADGRVILTDPNRSTGREFVGWIDEMWRNAWRYEQRTFRFPPKTIRLFELGRVAQP